MSISDIADEAIANFKSLSEHDKTYHKDGFKKGQRCKYRESLEHGDKFDSSVSAAGMLSGWIPGLEIQWVSGRDADKIVQDNTTRRYITEKEQNAVEAFVEMAFSDFDSGVGEHKKGKLDPNVTYRISEHYYPVMNRCFGLYFGDRYTGPKHIAVSRSFLDQRHHSSSSHITKGLFKDLLKYLDDPLAVLPPINDAGKDSLVFVYHIPELKSIIKGTATEYIAIPVMYNDKNKQNTFLQPLTAYVVDRADRFAGMNALYVDDTKPADLSSLRVKPKTLGLPTFTVRQASSLKRKNFASQMLGIISHDGDRVKPSVSDTELESRYENCAKENDYENAFRYMEEYARRKGYVWHSVPMVKDENGNVANGEPGDFKFSCFVSMETGAIKSDGIEYDEDGKLISLGNRFRKRPWDERFIKGMEEWHNFDEEKLPKNRVRGYEAFFHGFSDSEGKTAGWYDLKSKMTVLVKGRATPKVVAHEIGWHATYEWAKEHHPELYNTLRKYAEEATPLVKASVHRRYGKQLEADALLDEIGAERFTRDNMGMFDIATKEWWDKVEKGQDKARARFAKDNAHRVMSKEEIDEIAKLPPKQAVERLVEAMISGRSLGGYKNSSAAKDAFPECDSKDENERSKRIECAKRYLRM